MTKGLRRGGGSGRRGPGRGPGRGRNGGDRRTGDGQISDEDDGDGDVDGDGDGDGDGDDDDDDDDGEHHTNVVMKKRSAECSRLCTGGVADGGQLFARNSLTAIRPARNLGPRTHE